jgi:hypothetical protein
VWCFNAPATSFPIPRCLEPAAPQWRNVCWQEENDARTVDTSHWRYRRGCYSNVKNGCNNNSNNNNNNNNNRWLGNWVWAFFFLDRGWDSSVGIATRFGLDGPEIESLWGEIFCTRPDRPWGPPSLLYNPYRVSFVGLKWPGSGVDHPPPHLAPRLKKE